jgi:hypothetical protein
MPLPSTLTPIATNTLTATATTITFSSIPQTYTDLVLVASFTSGNNDEKLQFNGDTASNYSWIRLYGDGASTGSGYSPTPTYIRNTGSDLTTQQNVIINIFNYANSTNFKTTIGRGNNTAAQVTTTTGVWRNTAAITSITYASSANTFSVGSTFTLYGIKAA